MANKKISELTNITTPLDGSEQMVFVQSTTTKKGIVDNIKTFLKTYFDTLYQSILISGTNIKTINGNSLLGSGDLVISGGGGSGIFGIPNASGVYTYYATLTLAMAAAVSGNTIEMFADVTETAAVTITLKNGVNINGNGHTYTLNNSGLTHALTVAVTVATSCNINNLNVIRTGSTGTLFDNSCLTLGAAGSGVINCAGSTFRNSGSGVGILFNTNSTHEINYL